MGHLARPRLRPARYRRLRSGLIVYRMKLVGGRCDSRETLCTGDTVFVMGTAMNAVGMTFITTSLRKPQTTSQTCCLLRPDPTRAIVETWRLRGVFKLCVALLHRLR